MPEEASVDSEAFLVGFSSAYFAEAGFLVLVAAVVFNSEDVFLASAFLAVFAAGFGVVVFVVGGLSPGLMAG